jgi:hypothetical protein
MAIDMLENNELSALAPSRLGMKNFVNDKPMKGRKMPKQEENFANLFGSANRKKLATKVQGKWSGLPTDCASIDSSIKIIEEDIASQIKKSSTQKGYDLKSTKLIIQESQTALGDLKKMKASNCAGVEAEAKAVDEQKFQEKLQKISEDAISKAKGETTTGSSASEVVSKLVDNVKSNKNVYLIGGGILVLGIVAFFVFKKK